ncbi:MAG: cell division protein FtsZ [Alphaproteobacteria bacterium]|nr:cell division protein FtsZ [Alphaproteobacteria bacterium]
MGLILSLPGAEAELKPRITVIGVGGAGCNAVNNMIRSSLDGVEFVVANTDAQALRLSQCERRVQLGMNVTNGLGSGARPDVGRASAEECLDVIQDHLQGSNMAFITAGMGGGTGTGAAPVIARVARELGILTVGVVTKPFHFEGQHRMALAEEGLRELQEYVDTLIVIPNQNLFRVANEKTTFADAFKMADNVLYSGVRGVTDLMIMPGLINLDFADIRTVMAEMGKAMMGTGEASGERRAIEAAEAAIANPLLEDVSMKGARGLLINITGGLDMTLFEVDEAANRIREEVDEKANIIFGSTFDQSMEGVMRVSIVATGIEAASRKEAVRPAAGNTAKTPSNPPAAKKPEPQPIMVTPPAPAEAEFEVEEIPEPIAMPIAATGTDGPMRAPMAINAGNGATTGRPASTGHPLLPQGVKPALQPAGSVVSQTVSRPAPRPVAEAAAESKVEPRKSGFDLFKRVTNAARGTFPGARNAQPTASAPSVSAPVIRTAAPAGNEAAVSETPQGQDGVMEIPSFLRRQAN